MRVVSNAFAAAPDPAASRPDSLVIHRVGKVFGSEGGPRLEVLSDIDLSMAAGSITCIIGASGCGKSTLLRIVAGLETEFTGRVSLDGRPILGPGLDRGVVFQDHRLVPWMSVARNVALGLHRLPAAERNAVVAEKLALVGLSDFADAYPAQLSGGMAQRVALARALAPRPGLLLMDEPFGALDALTKMHMQEELLRIRAAEAITIVLVTHDIEEALYLGDRVVVMSSRPGRIETVIDVGLPLPRDRTSPDLARMRHDIYGRYFAQNAARPAAVQPEAVKREGKA